jgi:hypothetical protein
MTRRRVSSGLWVPRGCIDDMYPVSPEAKHLTPRPLPRIQRSLVSLRCALPILCPKGIQSTFYQGSINKVIM